MVAEERWWEQRNVPEHGALCFRLGPLSLWLENRPGAWNLAWERGDEADHLIRLEAVACDGVPAGLERTRYVFGHASTAARLSPVLADRPVVVKAYEPVFVPSGEEITLFISSPVLVRVEVGQPPHALTDIATVAMSDTWFGPSTREGELCFAARTHARHSLSEVQRRPHRAVTPVRIRNRAASALPIERLSIPLPVLAVYGDEHGGLWTEAVTLERTSDSDLAALRVDKGAPVKARAAQQVSPAHRQLERGSLIRAFGAMFGTM